MRSVLPLSYVAGITLSAQKEGIRRVYTWGMAMLTFTRFTVRQRKREVIHCPGYSRVRPVYSAKRFIPGVVLVPLWFYTFLAVLALPPHRAA